MSDNLFDRPEYDPGFYHVPQYYEMDPTSDELLFDGGELEDGMIVLIENPGLRVPDVDSWLTAYGINLSAEHIDNLRVWNRWCEVTDLVIDPEPKNGHHCTERMVRFVGVYADDVKRKRVVPYDEAWLRQRPAEPIKIVNDVPNIWYRKIPETIVDVDHEEALKNYPELDGACEAVKDAQADLRKLQPEAGEEV